MEQKAPPPPFRLSLISWAAARPSVHDASDAELGWIENRPERSGRSEERRVGEECVSTCRSRWSPDSSKKHHTSLHYVTDIIVFIDCIVIEDCLLITNFTRIFSIL